MDTLGLIAGNGQFPIEFLREARKRGLRVVVAGLEKETDPSLEKQADVFEWFSIGQLGKAIAFFKSHEVRRAVMAGQVHHHRLFTDFLPDLRAMKVIGRVATRMADSLLGAVAEEFSRAGIELQPSTLFLEHLIAPEGILGKRRPTEEESADLSFGMPLASQIAGLDIGQTIVVKGKTVVAVEAMEGTDACILRAGQISPEKLVVVKVARPKQDPRFDVPVVGMKTVESLLHAKAAVLAVEAGKTLILEKDRVIEALDCNNIAFVGIKPHG